MESTVPTRNSNTSKRLGVTRNKSNINDHDIESRSQPSTSNQTTQSPSRHRAFSGARSSWQTTTDHGSWYKHCSEQDMLPAGTPHQDLKLDLRGIGAQFEGYNNTSLGLDSYPNTTCSYHQPILDLMPKHEHPTCTADHLNSYILGDPAEQYALYYRVEAGCLSTMKDCTCFGIGRSDSL